MTEKPKKPKDSAESPEVVRLEEANLARDEVIRRMANTPPKPDFKLVKKGTGDAGR